MCKSRAKENHKLLAQKASFLMEKIMQVERRSRQTNTTKADIKKWRDGFTQSASDPVSQTAAWVQVGVERRYSQDTPDGRRILAEDMGTIFAFVYDEETGSECFYEELKIQAIHRITGIPYKRLKQAASLLVETGVIKSKDMIDRRQRKNGYPTLSNR